MITEKKYIEKEKEIEQILKGLQLAYERLIADKKAKKEKIVVLHNNKIKTVCLHTI